VAELNLSPFGKSMFLKQLHSKQIIKMKLKNIIYLFAAFTFFSSCEDIIDVDLAEGDNQLVVDAWVNNLPQTQTIRLSRTIPYFENNTPPAETGAIVTITEDDGSVYNFEDSDNDGSYTWTPAIGTSFGQVSGSYMLDITTSNGKIYTATSTMNRIMPIDSITLEEREEELGDPAGIYAELFARDFLGEGDAYWIKTFKNGDFLNKPQEINIAWDAAFTPGSGVDGVILITPIRENINRVPDDGSDAEDNNDVSPWALGDSINVEIHSLNADAFRFLSQSLTQMTIGDAGIFAEPPANVSTNMESINPVDPSDKAIGFFNVSAVSARGRMVEL
jgi:hypothetical protein